jgi:hypothetical protein
MKTHFFLVTLAMSSAAWAADPAMDTAPASDTTPATETAAPASQTSEPAAEQETSATTAEEQQGAGTSEQAGFSRGSVVRSVFTTAVKDREPVDKLGKTEGDADHIYFFTELRDMSGQTAIHRWEHNGKVAAEVKFNVRGPRWRVWSSKTLSPQQEGEWKVSVVNGAGEVIAEDMIDYTGPAESKPATDEQPASEQEQTPSDAPMSEPMTQ